MDGVAVRNANAAGGHADLKELKIKSGSFSCWMKAGREGPLGEERRQRGIDMWEAFNAEQLMMKVGELEHVDKKKVKNGEQEEVRVCSTRHPDMLRAETP